MTNSLGSANFSTAHLPLSTLFAKKKLHTHITDKLTRTSVKIVTLFDKQLYVRHQVESTLRSLLETLILMCI